MANIIQQLATKYRNYRKQDFLQRPSHYKNGYAIIGTGQHAVANLYPCIWYLGVPVKKICSSSKKNAVNASLRLPNCSGTDAITDILNDDSIKGVFVCVPAAVQAAITKQLLQSGKHVFVEKPAGHSLAELNDLLSVQKDAICQVGLQRRFSAVTNILKKHTGDAISYQYQFLTGSYPEGNPFYELFIHPIDFVTNLFGEATLGHISSTGTGHAATHFISLRHKSVKGVIELSTDYSWTNPVDEIKINTQKKIITASYPYHTSAVSKPSTILSVPLEKVTKTSSSKTIYLDGNSFIATGEMSSYNLLGFYPELKYFVESVEKNKRDYLGSLESLLPVYELLELLQKS